MRKYGNPPFTVALLHGGPGGPGGMAPVARGLANTVGVLEPFQTQNSLQGQIDECRDQIIASGSPPVTLIGSSWGAMLALFVAAKYPEIVRKLILIGCGTFDAKNSAKVEAKRRKRLSKEKLLRYEALLKDHEKRFKELPELFFDTDVYDPLTTNLEIVDIQYEIFSRVWPDFVSLREQEGLLSKEFSKIIAPTVVIHGDYDPHPIEGIRPFLEGCLKKVHFHILPKCGHYPWIERHAKKVFFDLLIEELNVTGE